MASAIVGHLSTAVFVSTLLLGTSASHSAEITVMGYRAVFEEKFKKSVIEPFMQEHPDIKINYYGSVGAATSLASMRAQRDAPQVNVVISDLSVAKIASDEGLLAEIDTSELTNYADISDNGKNLGGLAIPLTYDTLSLIYNRDAYKEAPTSWEALWDPARKGKVIVPAEGGGDIQAIILTVIANRLAGQDNYEESIEPAVEKLVELAPSVQTWEPKPDQYSLVGNGTADISVGYNARSQHFFDQTEGRQQSVGPVEGTATQINVISAVKNAPEMDATKAFIDYALSPKAQATFAKAMFYAPTNRKAEVDEATRKRIPLLSPDQQAKLINVDWMKMGDMREKILQAWRRQIIPAGR